MLSLIEHGFVWQSNPRVSNYQTKVKDSSYQFWDWKVKNHTIYRTNSDTHLIRSFQHRHLYCRKDVNTLKQIMPHVEDRPKDTSEGKSWVIFLQGTCIRKHWLLSNYRKWKWVVTGMQKTYSSSSGPKKNKQWQTCHPYTIKCSKYIMLKITSDFGMKLMTKTSLAATEVFFYHSKMSISVAETRSD